jgi:hypothetical protein
LAAGRRRAVPGHAGGRIAATGAAAVAARKPQRQRCRQHQDPIATPHQRVDVVELGDELVAPPLEPELLDGEVLLPELDPMLPELEPLPLVPGPPIELVLPLLLGEEPPLLAVSLLLEPLLLGLVLAVLGLVGDDLLLLLDDAPGPPAAPVVASRLLQALSERAATTARVAVAHWVRDIFIGNS